MISEEQEKKLRDLLNIFLIENEKINLSAFRDEKSCWIGNVMDSVEPFLSPLPPLQRKGVFTRPCPLPLWGRGTPFNENTKQKKAIPRNILFYAREMRKYPTEAEKILWNRLKDNKLGIHFRRQHPIGGYIVDFYCHEVHLAIEVDGEIHDIDVHKQDDKGRQKYLEEDHQTRFLRFKNKEIIDDISNVIKTIKQEIQSSPPPLGEGLGVGVTTNSTQTILDLGTGGGFPLLPLAICFPQIQFTGLDSTKKKIDAIKRISDQMSLKNVDLICTRAEEIGHNPSQREIYDLVTARAVAPLNTLLEFTSPFAKPEGLILCWKSLDVNQEIEESVQAQKVLNCQLINQIEYELPEGFGKRQILVFNKTSKLDAKYPRATGIPKKKPISTKVQQ